jgi:hypothetical protein
MGIPKCVALSQPRRHHSVTLLAIMIMLVCCVAVVPITCADAAGAADRSAPQLQARVSNIVIKASLSPPPREVDDGDVASLPVGNENGFDANGFHSIASRDGPFSSIAVELHSVHLVECAGSQVRNIEHDNETEHVVIHTHTMSRNTDAARRLTQQNVGDADDDDAPQSSPICAVEKRSSAPWPRIACGTTAHNWNKL